MALSKVLAVGCITKDAVAWLEQRQASIDDLGKVHLVTLDSSILITETSVKNVYVVKSTDSSEQLLLRIDANVCRSILRLDKEKRRNSSQEAENGWK